MPMKQQTRRYTAVVFDLFGTLVDNFSTQQRERVLSGMADVLHVPQDDFIQLWNYDTWYDRTVGSFATIEANIEYICQKIRANVQASQIAAASRIWLTFKLEGLTPLPGSIEVLSHLKTTGYRLGLVSDCSVEVPLAWNSTPFASLIDSTIFSCQVGLKKPDLCMYQMVC